MKDDGCSFLCWVAQGMAYARGSLTRAVNDETCIAMDSMM
jgi:hypothetical protein